MDFPPLCLFYQAVEYFLLFFSLQRIVEHDGAPFMFSI